MASNPKTLNANTDHKSNGKVVHNPWSDLRRFTDARIGLGRAGISLPTSEMLAFQLSHAQARDAVGFALNINEMSCKLSDLNPAAPVLHLHSQADDRTTYLQRPDLGRKLNQSSRTTLASFMAEQKQHTESKYDLAIVLHNLGFNYKNNKQYELAEKYAKESYNISLDLKLITGQSNNLKLLGNIALTQKKYNKAIKLGLSALTLIEESKQNQNKLQIYELLQKAYLKMEKYDLAYHYLSTYQILNDSISNENITKITNELETKYQVQQQEAENKLLKAEQKAYQKTIQSKNISIIAAILGLLLLGVLVGINYHSKTQATKYNELLEKTVNERTAELAQANYELRTFSYIASHDIKEPIRNIGNFVGLIRRRLPKEVSQDLSEYFETIKLNTKQLYTVLEDFAKYLSLSKNESTELNNVNLNKLMYNIVYGLSETINKYQGQVIYTNLPIIQSNNSFLFSVLRNVVENGLKYNQSKVPTVRVEYQETFDYHQIIVTDNGIGIEQQYHEKIFEIFKRLHNRKEYEGSGVGLAIVKLIVEKLNGHIQIESELNKGTSITINLPKERVKNSI
mgnify:CR=1 FL=1